METAHVAATFVKAANPSHAVDLLAAQYREAVKSLRDALDRFLRDGVPPSPEMPALMARVVGGVADERERLQFAGLWQDRVRRILLQHAADPALLMVRATYPDHDAMRRE